MTGPVGCTGTTARTALAHRRSLHPVHRRAPAPVVAHESKARASHALLRDAAPSLMASLMLALFASPTWGQQRRAGWDEPYPEWPVTAAPSLDPADPAGGLGGAVIGGIGGAAAGLGLYLATGDEDLLLTIASAVAGLSVGMPVGAWSGGGREGSLESMVLGSLALGAGGLFIGAEFPPVLLALPIAQTWFVLRLQQANL